MKNIISGSFLRDFYYTNEPFGVLDGRLYTINKDNNTSAKNFLSINNGFYIINESEEIEILEKKLFLQRKGEIESAVSAYIASNIGKIKEGISNFNELNNYYKSFENNSIEKFLMVDVIDAYNHSDKEVSININVNDFNEHQMPSIEDLIPKKNFLGTITKDFLVFEKNVYLLEKTDFIIKNFVILNNKQYAINHNMLLKELCEKYETRLTKNIYDNLDKNKKELSSALEILSNQKKELDKRIKLEKNYSSRANKGYGNIRVKKKGGNHYTIILTVPPYIIEKNEKYYAFDSAEVGMTIKSENNNLMVETKPFMFKEYFHPFVYSDGEICFGNYNWENTGLSFNKWYSLKHDGLAKTIAEALRRGKIVLERGYVNNPNPVNFIYRFDTIADSRKSAENYAKKNNISIDRIIKND